MVVAAIQMHGLAKQPVVAQAGRGAVLGDDADGKAAVHHAALDGRDAAHVQVQLHVGRRAREGIDGGVDARGRVAGRLVEQRHRQRAAHALVYVVHPGAKAVHRGQQAQRLVVHALALGRQRKARAPAPAQREAQARFQILDVPADGAGADVQLQLGRRQAATLDHRLEDLQQAQVHVADLAEHGAGAGLERIVFYLHECATKLEYRSI